MFIIIFIQRLAITTNSYVDTREKANKIIDRGLKVVGSLTLIGAVGALIVDAID